MAPRILIVDDDPDMVELLRLALTEAGFSVSSAADGNDALRKALRAPPDLVVLDLVLPGMNGFGVCEQLRLNSATASVPVLMITVLPGEFPRLVGVEAGADAYLNKPFRMEEFVSCVTDMVRRHGAEAQGLCASTEPAADATIPLFPNVPATAGTLVRLGSRA
jgi:DNA-binding response OmpR family regulator